MKDGNDFVVECTRSLLSQGILDQILSSSEVVYFYKQLCDRSDIRKCSGDSELDFEALKIRIQLSYISFICLYSFEDELSYNRRTCIDKQRQLGGYGTLVLSNLTFTQVNGKVHDFCSKILPFSNEFLFHGENKNNFTLLPPSINPSGLESSNPSVIRNQSHPTILTSTQPSTQ